MSKIRGFELIDKKFSQYADDVEIKLPTRSTQNSAGYDFYCPISVTIQPQTFNIIWTDVKAYMQPNEVLMLYVRSSVGIKKGLTLANGTGIIDSDYYSNPDNDGNIGICLYNNRSFPIKIKAGERIAQGIFLNYLTADSGNTYETRNGGMGSSGV